MPTTIKLKNSVTTTNTPTSLAQGEVAINITDKKVWVGNAATTPIQLLGAGGSASFSSLTCTSLTNSGLTSGRVTYAGTGGLLQDSANLTFNGTTLTANDITDSSLTANRVVYATTNGNLTNSANLTFDGTTLTTVNTINVPNTFGFKNRIINGAMAISQRNGTNTITPANGDYTIDRYVWQLSQTSKLTTTQISSAVNGPVGFQNYMQVTSSSAYSVGAGDYFAVGQRIEGFNTADLQWGTSNAKTVTLSFWVNSTLSGTFGGAVNNSAFNRSYPFTYTINSPNAWEYKTVTIAGDTTGTWVGATNGIGLQLWFGLGVGATYSGTAGSWTGSGLFSATGATSVVGTNGATFYITGVQLEVGSTATSFDYRPYGTELALCQRYYYRISPTASVRLLGQGQCFSTTSAGASIFFPVSMRTRPSSLEQTGTATDYSALTAAGGTQVCNAVPTFNGATTTDAAYFTVGLASGVVAGDATSILTNSSSSYLGWSAEL